MSSLPWLACGRSTQEPTGMPGPAACTILYSPGSEPKGADAGSADSDTVQHCGHQRLGEGVLQRFVLHGEPEVKRGVELVHESGNVDVGPELSAIDGPLQHRRR